MLTLVFADCDMKVKPGVIDSNDSHPELVHFSLMLANESRLAEEKELKTIVHTRYGKIFWIEPDVDIPEKLGDFKKLLLKAVEGDPIKGIKYDQGLSLIDVLNLELGQKIVMSPHGERRNPFEFFKRSKDYVVVIGGFRNDDFISPVYRWADDSISISDNLKKTWSVAAEVIVAYRGCSLE